LAQVPGRRAAILGDMLELGSYEEQGHREVGRRAAEVLDALVVVGRRARWTAEEAHRQRFDARSPMRHLASRSTTNPGEGEHILVKGSRSMSMEIVVAKLRAAEVAK
jgi:UDP-N-acetylmuramoyl-tripeptide--D-alanyl-D-alanine ligase